MKKSVSCAGKNAVCGNLNSSRLIVALMLISIWAMTGVSPVSAFLTISTNMDVTNNGATQNEGMVAINPLDHQKLVVGYNDYRLGGNAAGWSWSDDGGKTWTFGGDFSMSGYNRGADPVVAFDSTGIAYFAGLAYNQVGTGIESGSIFLAKSSDGGHTFNVFQKIVASGSAGSYYLDKPWLFINPANNNIYMAWVKRVPGYDNPTSMTIMFTRSIDGGTTFSAPIEIGNDIGITQFKSHGPQIAVGSGGKVYVSWQTLEKGNDPSDPSWQPPRIYISESLDGGVTFGSSNMVAIKQNSKPNRFISMGADQSNGKIYITFADRPTYPGNYDIYVAVSTSASGPWTIKKVNDDIDNPSIDHFWPSLSIAPNGRVDIIWYDQRDDSASSTKLNIYYSSSIDGGVTWEPNTKITPVLGQGFSPSSDFYSTGDYITIASFNDKAQAVWGDDRAGNTEIFTASLTMSPSTGSKSYLYVTNSRGDTVSVIDTITNKYITNIPVGQMPFGVAINPAGTKVYVVNYYSNNVSVIDITTNSVTDSITVGSHPLNIAVDPAGTKVYVVNQMGANTVSVIDASSNSVIATINVGDFPNRIAISPDGSRVYVSNYYGNSVSVIDTDKNSVISTISVGSHPFGVVVNPTGTKVYVANYDKTGISVIDTASNTVIDTIPAGYPNGLAINPSGTRLYVGDQGESVVYVIDLATNGIIASIAVGYPNTLAINSDGTRLYVANEYGSKVIPADTISVIDTVSNTVIDNVPVGKTPYGVAVMPGTKASSVQIVSSTGKGPVNFETTSGKIENPNAVDPSTLPQPPSGTNLFYGLFSFDITGIIPGSSATLTMTFPSNIPPGTTYWKYQSGHIPTWYSITPDSINGNELKLTLTDGGIGDSDNTANGIISDPGAPSLPSPGDDIAPTTEISGIADGGNYDNNVTITLTATDNPGGSGVNNTFYIMNICFPFQGGNCGIDGGKNIYEKPVDVYLNGNYTINFWSVDKAGNIEQQKMVNFTIKHSLNIISPNGGEDWKAGSTHNIQWKYTGPDNWPYIRIELIKGDSTEFIIAPGVPRGTDGNGSYNWTIPPITTSNDYKIKITDTTYPAAVGLFLISTDTSDSNFTISQNPNISSNLYVSVSGSNETISGKNASIIIHVDQDCILPGSDIVTKCPAQSVEVISSLEGIIYKNFFTTDDKGNTIFSFIAPITTIPKVEIINITASKPPNLYGNLAVPMNIMPEEANMPVNIGISDFEVSAGGNITVPVQASVPIGENISAVGVILSYNPDIITVSNVTTTNFPNMNISNGFIPGDITINVANSTGVSGNFSIVDVQFSAVSSTGTSPITIVPYLVHDTVGINLTSIIRNGSITITGSGPVSVPLKILVPSDKTVPSTGQTTHVDLGTPTITGGTSPYNVTNDAPSGNNFPNGITPVIWTAKDSVGQKATDIQNVSVIENGKPINSCTQINTSGYYILTNDIMNLSVDTCIKIESSDVILDGAGYTINAIDTGYWNWGITTKDRIKNVTIKNMIMTDWVASIDFTADDGYLIDNKLKSFVWGIILEANNNTIAGNDARIDLTRSNNNTVINNNASYSGGNIKTGIQLAWSKDNTLIDNIVANNDIGIHVWNSTNNTLTGNKVYNGINGIFIENSTDNTIYNNYFNNTNNFVNTCGDGNGGIRLNTQPNCLNGSFHNILNIDLSKGINVMGGPLIGGNYWANSSGKDYSQVCKDDDEDGICDRKYILNEDNIDNFPLSSKMPLPYFANITITPNTVILGVNTTINFTANGFDQFGYTFPIDVTQITWNSSNTSVGTIDTTGKFTALSVGLTTITVSAGTVSGNAYVNVTENVITKGDANHNNMLDVGDVLFIAQWVAGVRDYGADDVASSDVDGFEGLDVGDVLFVAQAVAGLRTL